MADKAIVILTNFWDANYVIDCGFAIFPCDKERCYKINFNKKEPNYAVHSIALRTPSIDKKLPHLNKITTLDFFCPTYDMLKRYKTNGDWISYTKDYHGLMRNRKQTVREWMNSLVANHIYLLCCWENTSLKAKCHRQLLFDAFKNSKLAQEKMIPFYCNGERKMRRGFGRERDERQSVYLSPGEYVFSMTPNPPITESNWVVDGTTIRLDNPPPQRDDPPW